LKSIAAFDHHFWRISPREALFMDPQHRIFLEVAWHTLEHAGYDPDRLKAATGVFVGVGSQDYHHLFLKEMHDVYIPSGRFSSALANRVSHLLNLCGPSEPIDTACSSSLVTIHRAVRAIRSGECAMALAGGVNLIFDPRINQAFGNLGTLSPNGRCNPFDISANGYVRGEGAGAVLLKQLQCAEQDGDYVHAVILGTAASHGGRSESMAQPNAAALGEVIHQAWQEAQIDAFQIDYIETHGSGTPSADSAELKALIRVLGEAKREQPLILGTMKANYGLLETASGIASFIKALLCLKHRTIPANIHFAQPHPLLQEEKRLQLSSARFAWPDTQKANNQRP